MKVLKMSAAIASVTAFVLGTSYFLFGGKIGHADDSSAADNSAVVRAADQSPPVDKATVIAGVETYEVPLLADRSPAVAVAFSPANDDKKSSANRNSSELNEKLRIILSRQKGDQLRLYLNERGSYVNGKSLSRNELVTIVRESGLKEAVISAEPYLGREKVGSWEKTLRDAGIRKVKLANPNPPADEGEKLRIIVHRQKGDVLKVYLNSRGAYVNGKSIRAVELPQLVRMAKLDKAVVSAEPYLDDKKVAGWQDLLKKAGVKKVSRTEPKQK